MGLDALVSDYKRCLLLLGSPILEKTDNRRSWQDLLAIKEMGVGIDGKGRVRVPEARRSQDSLSPCQVVRACVRAASATLSGEGCVSS